MPPDYSYQFVLLWANHSWLWFHCTRCLMKKISQCRLWNFSWAKTYLRFISPRY